MMSQSVSVRCALLFGLVLMIGLVWAQDSIAEIEFLEFLANWSEEEQYWLDAELDAFEQSDCTSSEPAQTAQVDGEPCPGIAVEEEGVQ